MKNKQQVSKKIKAKRQAQRPSAGRQIMRTLVGVGKQPRQNMKTTAIPLSVKRGAMRQGINNFKTYNSAGKSGVTLSGRCLVEDMAWITTGLPSNVSIYTRTIYAAYLNPALIGGKLLRLANNFQHYRFEKLCLSYDSMQPTTSTGEVMFGFTRDINVDPSELEDRNLRLWYDGLEGSYIGPVSAVNTQNACANYTVLNPGSIWFDTSQNGQNLDETFQGKVYFGVTSGSSSLGQNHLGELCVEYEITFCDTEESTKPESSTLIPQTMKVYPAASTPVENQTVQLLVTSTTIPPGVHQIFMQQDGPVSPGYTWSKLIGIGAEFIGAYVGVPGLASGIMTLYDTWSDFMAGNPTVFATASGTYGTNLVTQASRALLYDDTSYGPGPVNSRSVTKGLKLGALPTYRKLMQEYADSNPHVEIRGNGLVLKDRVVSVPTVVEQAEDEPQQVYSVQNPINAVRMEHDYVTRRINELRLQENAKSEGLRYYG
jgi:hypothetical protein